MDWKMCMNQAIDYIEDTLAGKIDYSAAARILNCSDWEFRRVFSMLAQIPLSEYIRRRRLSLAVADIQSGEKIIDTAVRYGYESQAAFSRAFRQFHGITPTQARNKNASVSLYPRLTFKLILMEGINMGKDSKYRTNIIGAGETSYAIEAEPDKDAVHKTNTSFWDTKGSDLLGTTSLPKYGAFVSEETCCLFGDVGGKSVLEIGCGSGRSLLYLAERGMAELWGIDISERQLKKARTTLESNGVTASLICSPMEEACGIPNEYFDFVCSIYGIGWTTDLTGTFQLIASYLKKGGVFIFSWSHPIHKCVSAEHDMLVFKKCYFDESWYSAPLDGTVLSLSDRKLSTYVNALAKAGFVIEEMVEESDSDIIRSANGSEFAKKAAMLPVTFVIKARKL